MATATQLLSKNRDSFYYSPGLILDAVRMRPFIDTNGTRLEVGTTGLLWSLLNGVQIGHQAQDTAPNN